MADKPVTLLRPLREVRGEIATVHVSWGDEGNGKLRVFVRDRAGGLLADWRETKPVGNALLTARVIIMDAVAGAFGPGAIRECVHSSDAILFHLR
ncbi:hypothetical protein EPN90_04215 [Patescibacteria group bacterium]|nr:MAG: hypothetical protein EPN90_04215 [Patescibacteria group bacterium]